jgi:putative FmdB family regulatory protein
MRRVQATKLQRNRCIFVALFKIMRRSRNRSLYENRQMPIYEYRCDNCSHEFESIQKLSDAPLKTCPACAQDTLRKKVSAAGFRLKGAGWYETDFKSGSKKNVSGDNGSGTSGGEGGTGDGSSGSKNGSSASKDGAAGSDGSGTKSSGDSSKSDSGASTAGSSAKSKASD